jgi:hypothetical protein
MKDMKLIERVKTVSDSISASNDMLKFYTLKGALSKDPKIQAYFAQHPGELDKLVNQILELPENARNAILT